MSSLRGRLGILAGWHIGAWLVVTLASLALLAWALRDLALHDGDVGKTALTRWREQIFWLNTFPVLVWSYTTFELIFRSKDASFLNTLPIAGAVRSVDVIARSLLFHLPLGLPAIVHAAWLIHSGHDAVGAYALSIALVCYPTTIACAVAVHLAAGRSLLTDPTGVRKMLAGQVVASEDAMLLWSPAAALVIGLLVMVISEILLFHGFVGGRAALVPYPFVICGVAVLLSIRRAHDIVRDHMFGIVARFAQAEIPPPYTEQGIPERTRSERLAVRLAPMTRTFFLRDRRQLRRRFRADGVVLVLFAVALGRLAFGSTDTGFHRAMTLLTAWLAVVGVFLTHAFRVRGELAAAYLDETLPPQRVAERRGRRAAAAIEPLIALALAATAALATGDLEATAWVVTVGLALTALLVVIGDRWAEMMRLRIGWASTLWRVGVLGVVSIATGVLSSYGGA